MFAHMEMPPYPLLRPLVLHPALIDMLNMAYLYVWASHVFETLCFRGRQLAHHGALYYERRLLFVDKEDPIGLIDGLR